MSNFVLTLSGAETSAGTVMTQANTLMYETHTLNISITCYYAIKQDYVHLCSATLLST